jgi:glycosyltransferase involved in cell wall biosynthesis
VVSFGGDHEFEGGKVRIAQVSPLYESVPPKLYGGTERVVSFLTESLVELGHDVTLFASGDSQTRARLIPGAPRALRLDRGSQDPIAHHLNMLERVFERADEFDVIHFHIDYFGMPLARRHGVPYVTTQHGRMDIADLEPLYRSFGDAPLVSISDAQRAPLPFASWQATVYHGLPPDLLSFHVAPGRYLAFLGRISPEKRVDRAIEIARRMDMPLKIAAKIDKADREYYEAEIAPLFAHPHVEFVGEIGEAEKDAFLGEAAALIFPVDWPEPFGLVMIEAMACGTPVIAFRCGSVPEVMRDGVSGFVVDTVDEAIDATTRALALPRAACRAYFEERFLAERMAMDYVDVYRAVIAASQRPNTAGRAALSLAALTRDDDVDSAGGDPVDA